MRAPAVLPRRAFAAALLSGAVAAMAVGLVTWGGLDAPRTESFQFSRGVNFTEGAEAQLRGFLTPAIADDRLAVLITGHTGSLGDAAANLALSTRRAERVAEIALDLGIPQNRITAAGVGGSAPVPKSAEQSEREYQSTLSRVDVTLRALR